MFVHLIFATWCVQVLNSKNFPIYSKRLKCLCCLLNGTLALVGYFYLSPFSPSLSPCLSQINGEIVAGYSSDKASKVIKKAPADRITLAVRDRPFERTITMQKDSSNHVGFSYNNGEIKAIVKDSSAAR